MNSKNRKGLTIVHVVLIITGILLLGAGVFYASSAKKPGYNTTDQNANNETSGNQNGQSQSTGTSGGQVTWQQVGGGWQAKGGTPPACPDPLTLKSPVELNLATAILYPGQSRGGNYKPHGGFRFDGAKNEDVTVTLPMDGQIVSASRYKEAGEVQYLFDIVNPCGIMYRFDHLLTLSSKFQAVADKLPEPKVDDSRTENINPPVSVTAGEVIATAVGFKQTANVSVDWGVYDLRQANGATLSAGADTANALATHAVCWLNLLPSTDSARAKSLPAGDATSGKTSDYCK